MTVPYIKLTEVEVEEKFNAVMRYIKELGMEDITALSPSEVNFDVRVRFKCQFSCKVYNTNLHCPPRVPAVEECSRFFAAYKKLIMFRKTAPPEYFAGEFANDGYKWIKTAKIIQADLVKAESFAFYSGFYLALGFGCGRCRWCADAGGVCPGLEKGICKHPYQSRPSMEAMGIDVFATAVNSGWNMSVIGKKTNPDDIEVAGYIGLLAVY